MLRPRACPPAQKRGFGSGAAGGRLGREHSAGLTPTPLLVRPWPRGCQCPQLAADLRRAPGHSPFQRVPAPRTVPPTPRTQTRASRSPGHLVPRAPRAQVAPATRRAAEKLRARSPVAGLVKHSVLGCGSFCDAHHPPLHPQA